MNLGEGANEIERGVVEEIAERVVKEMQKEEVQKSRVDRNTIQKVVTQIVGWTHILDGTDSGWGKAKRL